MRNSGQLTGLDLEGRIGKFITEQGGWKLHRRDGKGGVADSVDFGRSLELG